MITSALPAQAWRQVGIDPHAIFNLQREHGVDWQDHVDKTVLVPTYPPSVTCRIDEHRTDLPTEPGEYWLQWPDGTVHATAVYIHEGGLFFSERFQGENGNFNVCMGHTWHGRCVPPPPLDQGFPSVERYEPESSSEGWPVISSSEESSSSESSDSSSSYTVDENIERVHHEMGLMWNRLYEVEKKSPEKCRSVDVLFMMGVIVFMIATIYMQATANGANKGLVIQSTDGTPLVFTNSHWRAVKPTAIETK